MGRTAIVLGATGLTGQFLLNSLLENYQYSKVTIFVRSNFKLTHPKLVVHQVDLLKLYDYKEHIKADVVFCCIGTTKAKTPNKDLYQQIDYGIPVAAARICKLNNIPTFIVISAMGANANSKVFYNKTKGQMEQDVFKAEVENVYILRPSLITGDRKELRFFEWIAKQAMYVMNFFLVGNLKKYQSINAEIIAKAMIILDLKGHNNFIIESDKIKELVKYD